MNHDDLKQRVFALYDGELPVDQRPDIERHLTECADCRALIADWKRVAPVFFTRPSVEASEDFVERVMARIGPKRGPAAVPGWMRWLVPVAGFCGIGLFLFVGSPLRESTPVTENLLLGGPAETAAMERVVFYDEPAPDDLVGLDLEVL